MTSFGFFEILVILVLVLMAFDVKHVIRAIRWVQGLKKQIDRVQGDFRSQMNNLIHQQESTDLLESTPNTPEAMREWGAEQFQRTPRQWIHQASSQIAKQLEGFAPYLESESIGAFSGGLDEVDTHDILRKILNSSKKLYLPYCIGDQMYFAQIQNLDEDLTPGRFGILEPADRLRVPPEQQPGNLDTPQLLLIPGRTFDEYGGRIGRGKGFYDKYLSGFFSPNTKSHSIVKVGVSLDVQIAQKKLELQPHDQKMNYLISEKRILNFENTSSEG